MEYYSDLTARLSPWPESSSCANINMDDFFSWPDVDEDQASLLDLPSIEDPLGNEYLLKGSQNSDQIEKLRIDELVETVREQQAEIMRLRTQIPNVLLDVTGKSLHGGIVADPGGSIETGYAYASFVNCTPSVEASLQHITSEYPNSASYSASNNDLFSEQHSQRKLRRILTPRSPKPMLYGGFGQSAHSNRGFLPQKNEEGRFPCPHCTKTYLYARHLKRHMQIHVLADVDGRPYKCDLCGNTFSRPHILRRHSLNCAVHRGYPYSRQHSKVFKKFRLSSRALAVLEDWYAAHKDFPYPHRHEKLDLMRETSLNRKQLDTWLNNARRRQRLKPELLSELTPTLPYTISSMDPMELWLSSEDEGASTDDIDRAAQIMNKNQPPWSSFGSPIDFATNGRTSRAGSVSSFGSAFSDCPEARLSGPPKQGRKKHAYGHDAKTQPFPKVGMIEPALKALKQDSSAMSPCPAALIGTSELVNGVQQPFTPSQDTSLCQDLSSGTDSTADAKFRAVSGAAPMETSSSLIQCSPSSRQWDHSSDIMSPSQVTLNRKGDESKQKRVSIPGAMIEPTEPSFQCTFCHIRLSPKSWKRHEETQHLPTTRWICMPEISSWRDQVTLACVFCSTVTYGPPHAWDCKHRIADCMERSVDQRTFGRKDKLVQHLTNFHGGSVPENVMQSWTSSTEILQSQWSCGFCDAKLDGWNARARHIAGHFREGKDMSMWRQPSKIFSGSACGDSVD